MNTSSFNSDLVDTIRSYGLLQDRMPGDILTLPNQWIDVKINVNELVLSENINRSLESLYKNWLYILSYSVIPTNDLPDMQYYTNVLMDKGNEIDWVNAEDDFPNRSGDFEGINNIIKIQNTVQPNNYNIIATTTTNLMLLSGSGVTEIDFIKNWDTARTDSIGNIIPDSITVSDSNITHPSNGILFQSIKDMVVSDSKDLFVLDDFHKIVFKFDISGITTLDESILKNDTPGRLLTSMVGDDGSIDDKVNFINPICLVTVNDTIYVLDQHPTTKQVIIKQFDSHLNWIISYNLGVFVNQTVVDMEYNKLHNKFYILTQANGSDDIPKLSSFEYDFTFINTVDLLDLFRHDRSVADEQYKKIYFSIVNENMMYIVTNKNIYKKYASRPTDFIGRIKFEERNIGTSTVERTLNDITIYPITVQVGDVKFNKDEILLFEEDWNTIYRFVEDSGFENSFESSIDDKILTFDQTKIQPDENVDVVTYNKALYKTLYNNLILLENISRKFATVYDDKGLSQYVGFKYLNNNELELLRYEITTNNYISSNELVLTSTVNRCLKEIFDLQTQILFNMNEQSLNVFPDPNKTIILS